MILYYIIIYIYIYIEIHSPRRVCGEREGGRRPRTRAWKGLQAIAKAHEASDERTRFGDECHSICVHVIRDRAHGTFRSAGDVCSWHELVCISCNNT